MSDKWKTAASKIDSFINQCASECVNAAPSLTRAERLQRAARIKSLMQDSGMSRSEATVWADFDDDYKANASAR
jgi:hypothetical protein